MGFVVVYGFMFGSLCWVLLRVCGILDLMLRILGFVFRFDFGLLIGCWFWDGGIRVIVLFWGLSVLVLF